MNLNQTIGNRFVIADPAKDLLGQGGMGEVYRATDTQTGETVAVKALNPDVLARDPDLLERFQREGEALRRLNHPNIVRMVAAVEEDGRHYLVMEYVGGGSLEELLQKDGRLSVAQVVKIGLEVADALTRAHHLGIIHRDLKPANVLLASDGTPRLADFGIAHIASDRRLTQSGILMGTLDYLSPEICQGQPPNERSDIWAFGAMLYEMLAGECPFKGETLPTKITAILTQPVPDLAKFAPEVSEALADLIYRMLEKDPQQRIPSVRLVGAELEAILHGRELITPALRHLSVDSPASQRFTTPTPPNLTSKQALHNLPVQPTPFVGREAELGELARLLAQSGVRLVSILGVGGMGKSRLALEAGTGQLENYQHGVFFIPLAPLQSVVSIIPTIAGNIGFSFYQGGEPRQQLLEYLRTKQMVLILDNFEHLLDGANLVSEIIQTAPQMKILVTSRARLNLQGEQLFHLSGMDFPDWETPADALEYSAVKLFLQSARRVCPGFTLQADDLKYIARICRLVGGLPLGILLAAAWIECLTPAEIATEIGRSLDFLETDLRDVPERQHSLRLVFDHSWSMLTGREQDVFKGLSVFRGGFAREAAQQVTGATLRELMALVDKSLLQRDPAGRYGVHELLRQYAAEKLGKGTLEEQVIRDRHCACFAEFLGQRQAKLVGKEKKQALEEVATEIDNIQVAWDWAIAQCKIDDLNRSLESLAEFYRIQGWFERGENVFGRVVEKLSGALTKNAISDSGMLLGKALLWQGRFCYCLGLGGKANRLLLESRAIFRDLGARREEANALSYLGGAGGLYGNDSPEEGPCLEGLVIFKELGDRKGIALSLRGLAWARLHQGKYLTAKGHFQESLSLFREVNDLEGITLSLGGLGYVCWILGEYREAQRLHQEMLALSRETGDQGAIARSLGDLGIDACGMKKYPESLRLFQESLAIYREIGHARGIADELGDMGEVANSMGDYVEAAQYAQECLTIYRKIYISSILWPLRVLGNAAIGLGNQQEAKYYLHLALSGAVMEGRMGHALLTMVGIAALLMAEGEKRRALELLNLVLHHPMSWQLAKDQAKALADELKAELPADDVAAAQEHGKARNLEATVNELLVELGTASDIAPR